MRQSFIILTGLCLCLQVACKTEIDEKNSTKMLKFFKKGEPIDEFWSWFTNNSDDLKNFQTDPDKYLNQILAKAKKVADGLAIELETPKDGVIIMTVSADGNANLFPTVEKLVEKAPKLEGWKIVAFRQRATKEQVKEMVLKGPDHEIDVSKMKFFPIVDGEQIDIIIFLNGVTDENRNSIAYGCFLLVDNILGEYDCVKKVRSYDFHQMPTDQHELEYLRPLIELSDFVDKVHNEIKK